MICCHLVLDVLFLCWLLRHLVRLLWLIHLLLLLVRVVLRLLWHRVLGLLLLPWLILRLHWKSRLYGYFSHEGYRDRDVSWCLTASRNRNRGSDIFAQTPGKQDSLVLLIGDVIDVALLGQGYKSVNDLALLDSFVVYVCCYYWIQKIVVDIALLDELFVKHILELVYHLGKLCAVEFRSAMDKRGESLVHILGRSKDLKDFSYPNFSI